MRIMGTIYFPQQHTATNISDKLMDLRLDFGVYPKSRDGRPPQSLQAMRRKKGFYFREEHELDKPVLTSDCGSDVSAGSRKRPPLGLESVCLSLLEHSCSSCVEGGGGTRVFGTIDSIGGQIL